MSVDVKKTTFNYHADGADAFHLIDSVLESTTPLTKGEITDRLTELGCPNDYKKRATFLLKYMGVLGFGYCGTQADISPEEEYDSVIETFTRGDWREMTHKFAMDELGYRMSDLGYPEFGV